MITKRGRELAEELINHFNRDKVSTFDLAPILSKIARHARTYDRIQEAECNGEKTPAMARKEAQIEARVKFLIAMLPDTLTGRITVEFGGDPRGYTIKLVVPAAPRDGNTWGRDGRYGV